MLRALRSRGCSHSLSTSDSVSGEKAGNSKGTHGPACPALALLEPLVPLGSAFLP